MPSSSYIIVQVVCFGDKMRVSLTFFSRSTTYFHSEGTELNFFYKKTSPLHGEIRQQIVLTASQFGIQPLIKPLKNVLGHYKLTSFECATILSAALQLFAIKLPLHLNTN